MITERRQTGSGPVIIAVAPCGSQASKAENPATPYSPREIAEEIVRAAAAGAALAHVHARTDTGTPTQDSDTFQEIVDRVREKSDIIIEISLGTKGFTVEQAMAPLVVRPDGATLPYDAYDRGDQTGIHTIRSMAAQMVAANVRPGLGLLSPGSLAGAIDLMREGLAGIVPCAAVSVGSCDTVHQAVEQLVLYTQSLPSNCAWWIMKGGQHYLRLRTAAMALGGHVRVGFEDTVYQCDGTLANSNAVFVDQMVRLAHATGRGVASTGQAREILNMTARN